MNRTTSAGKVKECCLLVAVNDTASVEVVWAHFNLHSVLWEDSNVVLTHLTRDSGEHHVSIYLDDTFLLAHFPR